MASLRNFFRGMRVAVFDMAGTVGDRNNRGIVGSLVRAINHPSVTENMVAAGIGQSKRPHIVSIFKDAGLPIWDSRIDRILDTFVDEHEQWILSSMMPIDGVKVVFDALRYRGTFIGGTTGFPERLANAYQKRLAQFDIHFDYAVATDQTLKDGTLLAGRPKPDMYRAVMRRFNVHTQPATAFNFDDSYIGVDAAVAAGMTPCAVVNTGSYLGNQPHETKPLLVTLEFQKRGAKATLGSVADLVHHL